MPIDKNSLLIFSAPGPLGDRLSAFVAQLERVNTVGHVQSVLDAAKAISQHPPSLVILNLYPLVESTHDLLDFMALLRPGMRCLVLAESTAQAEQMGIDPRTEEVLVWGFSPETLKAKIDELVAVEGDPVAMASLSDGMAAIVEGDHLAPGSNAA